VRVHLPVFLFAAGCVPRLYSEGPVQTGGNWEPPENTWGVGEPPASLRGTGFDPGEVPPDFRLTDQLGDEVSLWQFYGQVVLFDVSTVWCAPCRDIAAEAQATQDDYGAEGFVYLTVLQQDIDGDPPKLDDVQEWSEVFGIVGAPVVGDDATPSATLPAIQFGQYPAVLLLDRDLVVRERVTPVTDEAIRQAIEAAL